MPKNATPRLADMIATETEAIMNKAVLRTALFGEKYFPAAVDGRDPRIAEYEAEHFDNPASPLFGDTGAATLWATLAGIKGAEFKRTISGRVTLQLGVVVVPVNSRIYTHPENVKVGEPYVCVNSTHGKFRGMDGEKIALTTNTSSVRPATQEEIEKLVASLLTIRPAQTIKVLGNALENVDGDE